MTEPRDPGAQLARVERYRRIIHRTGVLTIVVGAVLLGALLVGPTQGPGFFIGSLTVAALGLVTIATGILTIAISRRFPHLDALAPWVLASIFTVIGVGVVGSLAAAITPTGDATGITAALLVVVVTVTCLMLARANRRVLRTAAAIVAPPRASR